MAIEENTTVEDRTIKVKMKERSDKRFCLVHNGTVGTIANANARVDTLAEKTMLLADTREELVQYAEDNGIDITGRGQIKKKP